MKPAIVYSAQVVGLKGHIITIEVDLFKGFHTFSVVGLPDKAVEESRDRVSSAIKSTGFVSPKTMGQKKVVVSLAPAELKKEGALFDLPMALGFLAASDEIRFNLGKKLFLGELTLSGKLQPLRGALPLTQLAKEKGFEEIYLPKQNAKEAALVRGIRVFGVESLKDVVLHINEKSPRSGLGEPRISLHVQPETPFEPGQNAHAVTFKDIKGQETAKRGLMIAAAGGHNIAFWGPPGTGKTLLAKSFISILPQLSFDEAIEVMGIHSVVGKKEGGLVTEPPFRSPHHTSSHISIIGGGTFPKPGEATLAHRGVLFLDEFPEFDRRVIESLREPLESGEVSIARAKGSEVFPALFILIAAFNPCPCGYWGDKKKECICTPSLLQKYRRKISGPIIDRIDMWIEVPRIEHKKLSDDAYDDSDGTDEVREKILKAREIQKERFEKQNLLNGKMGVKEIKKHIVLPQDVKNTLNAAAEKLDLSARAYHRVMRLARTIADLEENGHIEEKHVLEALQYRPRSILS